MAFKHVRLNKSPIRRDGVEVTFDTIKRDFSLLKEKMAAKVDFNLPLNAFLSLE